MRKTNKTKSDKEGTFVSENNRFCKRNIETKPCKPRIHTVNGAAERAIQTMKPLKPAYIEDGRELTGRSLRNSRITKHTGM